MIVKNIDKDDNRSFEEIKEEIKKIYNDISSYRGEVEEEPIKEDIEFEFNYTKEEYLEKIEKCKEYIRKGDIFQVVFSQQISCNTKKSGVEIYRRLREENPSPYMFYIDNGDFEIVGASPESLVSVKDGIVLTNPIAGTRKRGATPKEDLELEEELRADEKEKAEHVMLVDLGRNDIGRISEIGTVKVEEFMEIERFSHVMHMTSQVSGKLRKDLDSIQALISCMPAGTVSGAPKIRAMEIIEELENRKRGVYAGAVGYFSYGGNMDMSIAIRTAVIKDGKAFIQAGGGIVYDSDPELEYQETLNKARILMEVLR
jgi:anthranilate synthase component 1